MQDREIALILEDMRSDFRAFKEGLDVTNKKLDGAINFLQNMMYEHEKWLQDHNVKIGDHEIRLKSVEKKVA